MTPGTIYSEDALKKQIKLLSNIMKDDIYRETLQKALDEKVILCVTNPFGKKEYVLSKLPR
jgi:hypothetical protein